MTALLILAGAFIYRMRGGMKPSFPRPVDQLLFSLPYAAITLLAVNWWAALIVLILTTLAISTGHGQYFLNISRKKIKPERLDFIVRIFFGKDPRTTDDYQTFNKKKLYWRSVFGMAVTGLAITLPCGIATMNPVIAISGLLKAPAYMLSLKGDAGTEGGELLTGALLWGVLL
ncbi:MAG: hypothetical protein ACUZ8E_17390 [Candidatus Anammoxibacter sp.]